MTRAIWKGVVIAESEQTEVVEGNHYFPPDSVHKDFFRPCDQSTRCSWKGTANYYDVVVEGEVNRGAAWYYPNPLPEASSITGYVAFWKGIAVQ